MSNIIVTTKNLIIREIEDSDRDLVYRLVKQSSLASGFLENDNYVQIYCNAYWDEINRPSTYNGMIFLKRDSSLVGKICMQCIDCDMPELGIDIIKSYQNQGYGPEAIIAFCNWYSTTHGARKIKIRISEENTHSIHVFEKLGAKFSQLSSCISEQVISSFKKELSDKDLTKLALNRVRDYYLELPTADD